MRVIAERGNDGVRVADVAHEIGMTPGTVSYYFPAVEDLLLQAHQAAFNHYYEQRLAAAAAHEHPCERLVAAIEAGIPDQPDDAWRVLAQSIGTATRSVPHAALLGSLTDREISVFASILELGVARGCFTLRGELRDVARTIVHLTDAVGLETQLASPVMDPREARRLVLDYARMATCLEAGHRHDGDGDEQTR